MTDLPEKPMTQKPRPMKGLPKGPNGPNAMEMLLSHVEGDPQDEPHLTEEFWYASEGLVGPDDPFASDPDQEGPPGAAVDK